MSKLLVSVRSIEEAEAALLGGAALIDVKEPSRGSLGRADDATVAAVLHYVGQRRPVSAALGEWRQSPLLLPAAGLRYVKWGLARAGLDATWRTDLAAAAKRLQRTTPTCQLVAVAYADWERAKAPPPAEVCAFASELACGAFMLDTWCKDGTSLLDWLHRAEIAELTRTCRAHGIPVALAGSLRLADVPALLPLEPDWFAVRGSVCHGGSRGREIDPEAVRCWAEFLARSVTAATAEN
jgi:uncharacterized protein (UPF0264 family)